MSQLLTVPQNAATRIKNEIKRSGYPNEMFARTKLGVGKETLSAWLSGSLPISAGNFQEICLHLGLHLGQFCDEMPELRELAVSDSTVLIGIKEAIKEEGLLTLVAKHNQKFSHYIEQLHLSPMPFHSPFVMLELRSEQCLMMRIIPNKIGDFLCVVSQQLCTAVHVDHTKIRQVNGVVIVESLVSDNRSHVLQCNGKHIDIALQGIKGSVFFIESDHNFHSEKIDAVNEVEVSDLPIIKALCSDQF